MRVDGATDMTVTYNSKPVQIDPVQVNNSALENKKTESNVAKDSTQNSDFAQQLMAAKQGELPISEKLIVEAIDRANKAIVGTKREFEYSIHKVTHDVSVKVIDSDTKEIVREIPPEKILDLVANMMELAGILVDEKR